MASGDAVSLKVYFVDGEYETVTVTPEITALQLRDLICMKVGILPADGVVDAEFRGPQCFGIWCCGDDLELELSDDHLPFEYLSSWRRMMKQYSNVLKEPWYRQRQKKRKEGKVKDPPCKIYFRTTALLSKPYERKFPSPGNAYHTIVVEFLWRQAHQWLLNAYYPEAHVEESVELAGLFFQIKFGDHNPSLHKANFVPLKRLIPYRLLKKKKEKEWYQLILAKHESLAGRDRLICQLLYLQLTRQWKTHNATMFEGVYEYDHESMFEHPFEKGVVVGCNADGLFFVDLHKMKYLYFYHWSQILEYEAVDNVLTIIVQEDEHGEDEDDEKTHVIKTRQADLVVELIDAALDDIDAEEERVLVTAEAQRAEREQGA